MAGLPTGPVEIALFAFVIAFVIAMVGMVVLSIFPSSYKKIKIPKQIPSTGFKFTIAQVMTNLTHDGAFPSVTLFLNHLSYRLLFGFEVKYSDIIQADLMKVFIYGPTLVLMLKGKTLGLWQHRVYLSTGRIDNALELAKFFKEKRIKLTPRALKAIESGKIN